MDSSGAPVPASCPREAQNTLLTPAQLTRVYNCQAEQTGYSKELILFIFCLCGEFQE